MGLDLVELVLAYEEAFCIQIPDADAGRLETVGLMHDYIMQATADRTPALDYEDTWRKTVAITAEQLGLPPEAITRDAYFIKDLKCS